MFSGANILVVLNGFVEFVQNCEKQCKTDDNLRRYIGFGSDIIVHDANRRVCRLTFLALLTGSRSRLHI